MAWTANFKQRLLARLSGWFIRLVAGTCRVSCHGHEVAAASRRNGQPLIYLFWHRHIFFVISQFQNSGARPLISLSQDGSLVSRVAERFGMVPIRGSSSRGGARAFLQLINCLKEEKSDVLITADGPKGPAREIKDGTIQLAAKTGASILPISWYSTRVKVLRRSWDHFLVPLPFGRVHFGFGRPMAIPDSRSGRDFSRVKQQLKGALDQLELEMIRRCQRQE